MKSYNEKWVKQRGSAVEEFKGTTQCSWNDVPLKNSEFNRQDCEARCDEDVFKMLTSPYYFTSLKTESQRAALFKIAGAPDGQQIAGDNGRTSHSFEEPERKSLDDFKKEVGAKKKAIKQDIESLPARIDERWRDISAVQRPFDKREGDKGGPRQGAEGDLDIDKKTADTPPR